MDIKIPWQAWYDETELTLSFPEELARDRGGDG